MNEMQLSFDELPQVGSADSAKLDKLAGSGFLPYVQLIGSSSKAGKSGKATMGHYYLARNKDKLESLTNSFECLVLARRARACRKTNKGFFTFFDQDSEGYKAIEEEAKGAGLTGCWHGTEYLLWMPGTKEFATYHASNATARTASSELNTILATWDRELKAAAAARKDGTEVPPVRNPQVKFTSLIVPYSNGNEQWGPSFCRATTPFANLPLPADVLEQNRKFCNPPKNKVEAVAEPAESSSEMG